MNNCDSLSYYDYHCLIIDFFDYFDKSTDRVKVFQDLSGGKLAGDVVGLKSGRERRETERDQQGGGVIQ